MSHRIKAENVRPGDVIMVSGSQCVIAGDVVSLPDAEDILFIKVEKVSWVTRVILVVEGHKNTRLRSKENAQKVAVALSDFEKVSRISADYR